MASPEQAHYSAFISYSHHDECGARRLQRALEGYRVPRRLRTHAAPALRPGGRLKPVFRDRDELTAAPDLSAAVRIAISRSHCLIVACTPAAARSEWVSREIGFFRETGGGDTVLAALFDGERADAFPPPLLGCGSDGTPISPLAADFRAGGDGWRLAVLKLVAAIVGVPLDALIQRDAQRRLTVLLAGSAAALAVIACITTFAVLMLSARAEAGREQALGMRMVEQLVDEREEMKKTGTLEQRRRQNRTAIGFFDGRDIGALPPDVQLAAARLLQGIAEDERSAGDLPAMRAAAVRAHAVTGVLLFAEPDDADRIMAHAQSEYWLGDLAWREGRTAEAERRFTAYGALADRLTARDPASMRWQREVANGESNFAVMLLQSGKLARAGFLFRSAQVRYERAAASGGWDSEKESEVADGYAWLADVARLSGGLKEARIYRERQRNRLLGIQSREPANTRVGTDLLRNQLALARVAAAEGRWMEATVSLAEGRARADERSLREDDDESLKMLVRGYELFEVQVWLDMPAANFLAAKEHPTSEQLAKLVGPCPASGKGDAESTTFCRLLQARLRDVAPSAQELAAIATDAEGRARFSPRWRIDFRNEVARITTLNGEKS